MKFPHSPRRASKLYDGSKSEPFLLMPMVDPYRSLSPSENSVDAGTLRQYMVCKRCILFFKKRLMSVL